jgi:hypothetical protein
LPANQRDEEPVLGQLKQALDGLIAATEALLSNYSPEPVA